MLQKQFFQIKEKLIMKQNNPHTNTMIIPNHHKMTQNLIKKKPKKQFELLYRERDQTTEENPIESIIFVKSKTCKTKQTNRKIKVQQQFNKIMKDLDAHLVQHKINKSTEKKSYSPTSSQMKATSLSKKQTKESDFAAKKSKATEKDIHKVYKVSNKGNDGFTKQKIQKVEVNKSPKKSNNTRMSPSSKRMVSPKSPKFEKQSIQSKRFTQGKIDRSKSPNHKKSNRKGLQNGTQTEESFNQFRQQKKTDIKRNIRQIPLKIEEYIFIEDTFQLIKQKSLFKLQTKLLSTYRNNATQFENKLGLKQKQVKKQIICEKLEQYEQRQNYLNFIEEPSVQSQEEMSEFNLDSSRQIKNFQLTEKNFLSQLVQKIIRIQQWWKRVIKIQKLKKHASFLKKQKKNKLLEQQIVKNASTSIKLPSVKSITFTEQNEQNPIEQQNQQMALLKNQNEIVIQKKNMHEKILRNLLKDNKINKDEFEAKMEIVEKQYERQLKDIMNLYKLCEGKTETTEAAENEEVKIIQGKKGSSEFQQHNIVEQQKHLQKTDEVSVKIYKIGDKITLQMQQYIQNAKKNKESSSEIKKNEFISDKYNKKTDEQGQEYYEDFQSEESSDASPHKALQTLNFEQFQANIEQNSNGSFQPNTNFIQMLQEFKEQQDIKNKIQQRIGIQMGALKADDSDVYTIDTSILGIHQFLVNFFKFYLYYYKDEFLRFINMPYGYQPEKRLKFIQGYEDQNEDLTEDDDGIIYGLEYIISDDVFEEFIDQYYGPSLKQADQKQKAIIECSQVHDRAIFECFNEALNFFRPYYSIGGPPYVWNCSEKTLTFYFIAEENVQEVFEKTEFKVMKWASALLGLYVPNCVDKKQNSNTRQIKNDEAEKLQKIEQIIENNQSNCHPMISQNREERFIKQERLQITDSMAKWNEIEEQKTSTLYELSSLILEELAAEFGRQFLSERA